MQVPIAHKPANATTARANMKDDFFITVKYLTRYTNRLQKILDDRKRWQRHRLELAESYEVDFERFDQIIARARSEFAAAREAMAKGETDEYEGEAAGYAGDGGGGE